MKANIFIFYFACTFLFFTEILAQETSNYLHYNTPPAPNAAALAKYGDIPVSYHTGTPEISIPIYTIQQGTLAVPISLSYHASGIKVDDVSSWVGLGWSLNAGGSVSRVIRGIADETPSQGFFDYGFMIDNIPTDATLKADYYRSITNNYNDSESDIYFYSYPEGSGKFTYDYNRNLYLQELKQIKINDNRVNLSQGNWEIFDSNGSKYVFDDRDLTTTYHDNGQRFETTSWQLSKIISADLRDTIFFEYQTETITYDLTPSEFHYQNDYRFIDLGLSAGCSDGGACIPPLSDLGYSTLQVDQKLIQKIRSKYVQVSFVSSQDRLDLTGGNRLSEIRIETPEGNLIKKFVLGNNQYFGATDKRLKLASVQEFSADEQSIPPYQFSYNMSYVMPDRLSSQRDHWGYLNNNPKTTFIPRMIELPYEFYFTFNKDGGDRETDPLRSLAYILEEIKYPTGGRSEFEFESNDIGAIGTRNAYEWYYDEIYLHSDLGEESSVDSIFTFTEPKLVEFIFSTVCMGDNETAVASAGFVCGPLDHDEYIWTVEHSLYCSFDDSYITSATLQPGDYKLKFEKNFNSHVTASIIIFNNSVAEDTISFTNWEWAQGIREINFSLTSSRNVSIDFRTTCPPLPNDPEETATISLVELLWGRVETLTTNYCGQMAPIGAGCGGNPSSTTGTLNYLTIIPPGTHSLNSFSEYYNETYKSSSKAKLRIYNKRDVTEAGSSFVGGARIVRIKNISSDGNEIVRRFKYEDNSGNSTGVLVQKPIYYFETPRKVDYQCDGKMAWKTCYFIGAASNSKVDLGQGTHIGYSQVSVLFGENGENGREEYFYTTSKDFPDIDYNSQLFPFAPPRSNSFRRGKLSKKLAFDNEDNLLSKTIVSYSNQKKLSTAKNLRVALLYADGEYDQFYSSFRTQTYLDAESWIYQKSETQLAYFGNDSISTSTIYHYDRDNNHLFPTRIEKQLGSKTLVTNLKYPQDYQSGIDAALDSMILKNIVQMPIEKQQWISENNQTVMAGGVINEMNEDGQPEKIWLYEGSDESTLSSENMTGDKFTTLLSDNDYVPRYQFDYNSEKKLILQEKIGDAKTALIWDETINKPIAEVTNANPDQIAYSSFETSAKGGWTYTYGTAVFGHIGKRHYQGSLSKVSLPAGTYNVQVWAKSPGANGTISVYGDSREVGQEWKFYAWTFNHGGGTLNLTVSSSVWIDEARLFPSNAQMRSFLFDPIYGITDMVDANGNHMTYQYDSFGRLEYVRDQDGKILSKSEYNYQGN